MVAPFVKEHKRERHCCSYGLAQSISVLGNLHLIEFVSDYHFTILINRSTTKRITAKVESCDTHLKLCLVDWTFRTSVNTKLFYFKKV